MAKAKIDVCRLLQEVRNKKPVIHHLTNWVTIYDCANIVKAFGASPVMAHAPEESGQMANLASALVLNIGTLTIDFIESMKIAAGSANLKGIPVILDVCGAGATKFRDDKSLELLDTVKIDLIKGNSSEIARIAGENVSTKGVDAAEVKNDLEVVARTLAKNRRCIVAVTGKTDILTDGLLLYKVNNGHEMMTHVVGTGCMATSVIGTFCAVSRNLIEASVSGLCCFEIAAELAAEVCGGPGTFKEKLFDYVFSLDKETIKKRQRIEC
jgi:hydroxyethylthiazole kinase